YSIPFIFNHSPTTHISTLSLHDALPISRSTGRTSAPGVAPRVPCGRTGVRPATAGTPSVPSAADAVVARGLPEARHRGTRSRLRSEEHTSELQSRGHLVCRLLLEKKKKV